ncbi:MAG: restriction endonuclease subunit S, partial [Treponema sp.]|nr:restriction endonuclease subunit S [Treponema sp.]
ENMAKTVYDYWFTQFDFPDANGTPYKSSGGKMEYNQVLKREIPAGWEVGKLGDYLDKFGDGIHGTPEYDENGDYYFINGNNLGKKLISFNSETLKVNANEYQKIKRPINENTIFLSINGTLGNISFYNGEKIAIGKSACFLNLKNEKLMTFVYQIISSENFQKYMYKVAGGSTIKNFAPKQAADFDIPIPPTAILEKFDKISHSCLEKQIKKEKENEELTNLRDYLLPLLMNGQIEVK